MNRIGRFLRELRQQHGEVLYDMAKRLDVSSAFLSAVENDKKSAPPTWIDTISNDYALNDHQKNELTEAVSESVKQIRLNLESASVQKKNCALAFARTFDNMSDEEVEELGNLMKDLAQRRN